MKFYNHIPKEREGKKGSNVLPAVALTMFLFVCSSSSSKKQSVKSLNLTSVWETDVNDKVEFTG